MTPHFLCLFCLLLTSLYIQTSSRSIPFREFSTSPALGRAPPTGLSINASDPAYGALNFFINKVYEYTAPTSERILFERQQWATRTGCTTIRTVGRQVGTTGSTCFPANTVDAAIAAYDAGSALNPVWGFMFNSVPFGYDFEQYVEWLYSEEVDEQGEPINGILLAQKLLDKRFSTLSPATHVVAFPVLGGPRQSSGYFQEPALTFNLSRMCMAAWTWRYLPPAENIIKTACQSLVDEGVIPFTNYTFLTAVPGGSELGRVQSGIITAFEFAAGLDNYEARVGGFFPPYWKITEDYGYASQADFCASLSTITNATLKAEFPSCFATGLLGAPCPACLQTPGHRGLRYVHYPAWHQPFFLGWMFISRSVWDSLAWDVQKAILKAAKESTYASYYNSTSVECDILQKILDINENQLQLNLDGSVKDCDAVKPGLQPCSADMTLATWKTGDLNRLKAATTTYLESLKPTGPAQPNNDDFVEVYTSMQLDMAKNNFKWKEGKFPRECEEKLQYINGSTAESNSTLIIGLTVAAGVVLVALAIAGIYVYRRRMYGYTKL